MKRWVFPGLLAAMPPFLCALLAAPAAATLITYTDRTAWEAELNGAPPVEDFEADTPGNYTTPYTTGDGILLLSMGDPMTVSILAGNWINGTRGLHYRDFSRQLQWVLPAGTAWHAFGFDYDTDDNDWEVHVGGEVFVLPDNTTGFFGVINREQALATFITTCDAYAQGGLLVDNLGYTEQVWGDIRVFTDRDAWEDYLALPLLVEDFETDTPGTYDLPYTTGHGFDLDYLVSAITIQIFDGIYMNGTRGLHYRDFSGQMEWRFPEAASTAGVGFDYDTDGNVWQLWVGDEVLYLQPNGIGFIGVVHTAGLLDCFVTTCTAYAQGGMTVDNVAFAGPPTGVEDSSWSRIKQLY